MDAYAKWLNSLQKTAIELWNDQDFFRIEELVPRDVFLERGEKCIELFPAPAIVTIVETRILYDSAMTINNWLWGGEFQFRGWRPFYYYFDKLVEDNPEMGPEETTTLASCHFVCSQHSFANAFDYDVRGYTAERARRKLIQWKSEGKLKFLTGIEKDVNWVHNCYRICRRLDDNGLFLF